MGLAVEENLKAVLDLAEETVRVVHDVPLLGAQAADSLQPCDRLERRAVANFGILAAIQQLEKLNDEFDVAYPPCSGLDFDLGVPGRHRALLDPALERLDLADLRRVQMRL